MLSNIENGQLQHRSVNACLCPLYSIDGMHVVTVEGENSLVMISLGMRAIPTI